MNVKKFRKFTKFLDTLLMLFCVVCVISLVVFTLLFIFNKKNLSISGPTISFPMGAIKGDVPSSVKFLANYIVAIIGMAVYSYLFFKGSRFFSNLSRGGTPFSVENYKLLKHLGLLLIAVNLIIPFIYSALITFLMPDGYYIALGLRSEVIIGLIIYAMAEVIRYGVTLQEFSDDAV